jgi:hypothetical protein
VLTNHRELRLEITKETQRLLGGSSLSARTHVSTDLSDHSLLAETPQSYANDLYREWFVFESRLKAEERRLASEGIENYSTPREARLPIPRNGDEATATVLFRLKRQVEDAVLIEGKRTNISTTGKRSHLGPCNGMKQAAHNMSPPLQTYTLDTQYSKPPQSASGEDTHFSPTSPQGPLDTLMPPYRTSFVSTTYSSAYMPSDSRSSIAIRSTGTADTSLEDAMSSFAIKSIGTTLAKWVLESGGSEWRRLCRKVQVERESKWEGRIMKESRKCDLHWQYRDDGGISICSAYRSEQNHKTHGGWTLQQFTSLGPGIPLITSITDDITEIEFPQGSFGRLEKGFTNIRYIVNKPETSMKLQTFLYTNNGKEAANLLYDRPIFTIVSNLNNPELRERNLRLWRRNEVHNGSCIDVVYILFYTNALLEPEAHWVEEPTTAFQMLTDVVDNKLSDRVTLVFRDRKSSSKWGTADLLRREPRPSSPRWRTGYSSESLQDTSEMVSQDSDPMQTTLSPHAKDTESSKPTFDELKSFNRFGYSQLEIKFRSKSDCRDFLNIWRQTLDPQLQLKEDTTRSLSNVAFTGAAALDKQPLLQHFVNRNDTITDSAHQAEESDFHSRTLHAKAPGATSLEQQHHGSSDDTEAEGSNAQRGEGHETEHLQSYQQAKLSSELDRQLRESERERREQRESVRPQ